ncbi:MAG: hypothetical protein BWY83_03034 [bacterium ADurb.Bin478]|nr:MAG: hypothetical protein BWY83_03034 [bacterium ADurb.Bin478]
MMVSMSKRWLMETIMPYSMHFLIRSEGSTSINFPNSETDINSLTRMTETSSTSVSPSSWERRFFLLTLPASSSEAIV